MNFLKQIILFLLISFLLIHFFILNDLYTIKSQPPYTLSISAESTHFDTFCADSNISIPLKVQILDTFGKHVPNKTIFLSLSNSNGTLNKYNYNSSNYSERVFLTLKDSTAEALKSNSSITVFATLDDHLLSTSKTFNLIQIPNILLYGYLSNPNEMENLKNFLKSSAQESEIFQYSTTSGIIDAVALLEKFITESKIKYLKKGIYTNSFNLIGHSFGGLVARYYTCSLNYFTRNDVKRLIFLSTPHNGTFAATFAENIFNDTTIKELQPESTLYTKLLPTSINNGLNPTIMTANLLSQNDEVVTPENATLSNWSIETEIFNIGENKVSMENILSGKIIEGKNHHLVLQNKKIFSRILNLTNSNLQYPKAFKD